MAWLFPFTCPSVFGATYLRIWFPEQRKPGDLRSSAEGLSMSKAPGAQVPLLPPRLKSGPGFLPWALTVGIDKSTWGPKCWHHALPYQALAHVAYEGPANFNFSCLSTIST